MIMQAPQVSTTICATALATLLLWHAAEASAGRTTNFGKGVPTPEQVVKALKPAANGSKTIVLEPASASLSVQLRFEFGSDRLTVDARRVLDNIGKGLQSDDLKGARFEVVGHTDSIGSEAYNKTLSERRAVSAKNYLVTQFNIDRDRIEAIGKGKSEPLNQQNPEKPENRRVEIVSVQGEQ
jgi:OmpA-OmpF porin, OOP family